jgi:hypothetical protein
MGNGHHVAAQGGALIHTYDRVADHGVNKCDQFAAAGDLFSNDLLEVGASLRDVELVEERTRTSSEQFLGDLARDPNVVSSMRNEDLVWIQVPSGVPACHRSATRRSNSGR